MTRATALRWMLALGTVAAAIVAAPNTHTHQQDATGLVTFDTQIRRYVPARSRASGEDPVLSISLARARGNAPKLRLPRYLAP